MTLFVLSYFAGALTILAPCILPVLPFVFARAEQPFVRSGLPLLAGLALAFTAVATLAAFAGGWAAHVNEAGRAIALATLAIMAAIMLVPKLADSFWRPFVALGARLGDVAQSDSGAEGRSPWASLLLGVATGLVWAPCAGPVLGLVLSTAALQGPSARTASLLLAYAAGAATSLALALWAGGRVLHAMRQALGLGQWVRKALGIGALASVAAIALGVDTAFLGRISWVGTDQLEHRLLQQHWHPGGPKQPTSAVDVFPAIANGDDPTLRTVVAPSVTLADEGVMPSLDGATTWLNSGPLTTQSLRGKVVLIDFWTFDCINCLNALPHVRAWAEKYRDQGLVVVGVHSPEFAYERKLDNVKRAVRDLQLKFPIAIDNDFAIWKAFSNEYWPAHYFIDAHGRIRFHKFGEGDYERSEQVIRQLLQEAHDSRPGE
jgi:cytochrome c biogenesis protein CcdA/thiol-disulfide isomerase/thioredoxin